MGNGSQINRDIATPVYVQVVNWLTSQIVTGNWQPNHQLLSEPDLADKLGVSRGSLRKAIGVLVARGMLEQVHGKGTFVRDTMLEQTWASRLVSTSEELNQQGIPFTTEVLAKEICDPLTVDFTTQTMVRDVLEEMRNLQLSKAAHTISAISADQTTSKWLGINTGEPVIYDEHILYDDVGDIVEFTKGWFRGDKMKLRTMVYREA